MPKLQAKLRLSPRSKISSPQAPAADRPSRAKTALVQAKPAPGTAWSRLTDRVRRWAGPPTPPPTPTVATAHAHCGNQPHPIVINAGAQACSCGQTGYTASRDTHRRWMHVYDDHGRPAAQCSGCGIELTAVK